MSYKNHMVNIYLSRLITSFWPPCFLSSCSDFSTCFCFTPHPSPQFPLLHLPPLGPDWSSPFTSLVCINLDKGILISKRDEMQKNQSSLDGRHNCWSSHWTQSEPGLSIQGRMCRSDLRHHYNLSHCVRSKIQVSQTKISAPKNVFALCEQELC